MTDHSTRIQSLPITEVENWLSGLVNRHARTRTRVVVENEGTLVAAIVSPEDLLRLDELDRQREADFSVIDELHEIFKDVSAEEIEREVDRVLAKKETAGGNG